MSARAGYFRIGLFVLSAAAILVLAVILFGAGKLLEEPFLVETYLDETVQGLEVGSPVKYRGVKLGSVHAISFVRDEYRFSLNDPEFFRHGRLVVVRIALDRKEVESGIFSRAEETDLAAVFKVMVSRGMRTRLAAQGLTGASYLEMDYVTESMGREFPAFDPPWTPRYDYIPSVKSTVSRVTESVSSLAISLAKVDLDQIARNIETSLAAITKTLNEDLPPALERITSAADSLARAAEVLADTSERDLAPTLANLRAASEDLPEILARLRRTLARLDALSASEEAAMAQTVASLERAGRSLAILTERVERAPGQALFGEAPPAAKPWER